MKTVFSLGISFITLALFSCTSQKTNHTNQDSTMSISSDTAHKAHLVGGDQDEHGCKASAGYSWSVLKQECIRPFELETKLKDLQNSTLAGYALFSKDNKQVELFAAEFKPTIILNTTGGDVYTSEDKKYKMQKDVQKHWFVSKNEDGKTILILQQD